MKSVLKSIDMFSFHIDFSYKNQKVFNTAFGFVLSFLVYWAMIFFFVYFSKDFFNKTNPMVIFRETQLNENLKYPIKDFLMNFRYNFRFNDTEKIFKMETQLIDDFNPIMYFEFNVFNDSSGNYESFIFNEKVSIYKYNQDLYSLNSNYIINDDKEILYFKGNIKKEMEEYPEDLTFDQFNNRSLKDINLTIDQNTLISFSLNFKDSFRDYFSKENFDLGIIYFNFLIPLQTIS